MPREIRSRFRFLATRVFRVVCDFSWRGDQGGFLVTALLGRLKIPMVNGLETIAERQAERDAVASASQ